MTDLTDRLFDVTPYGGAITPREARQRPAVAPPAPVVEPRTAGWELLRNRQGVMPYAHLVGTRAPSGAVITACGKIGTLLATDVGSMIRCPACNESEN